MRLSVIAGAALLALGLARPAPAQEWRGFISANGGYQTTAREFVDNVTFTAYAEQGEFDVRYHTPAAPLVDISGGARIWRNLGVGAGVSAFRKANAANVTARVPHPFFFNRRREASGDTGSLTREELAVHVQALWMVPVTDKIDVALFAGPSYFQVQQPFVDSLRYEETYPYDTTAVTGVNTTVQKKNNVGFNAGVDVSYMLTRMVGIGGMVRYSRATVKFTSADNEELGVEVGGPQAGVGVRVRF